ncbi:hypothetical protein QR680_000232 [Steinernema hermaphroditum]|uniref:Uncharacterized protein n=1 Tax=Steinernema hermaphroditum TaxID=289476 RepID=A0AA39GVG7_9BILA|nr:hypothetical protein QR680_000232 [Steinernema hermaphroditum]
MVAPLIAVIEQQAFSSRFTSITIKLLCNHSLLSNNCNYVSAIASLTPLNRLLINTTHFFDAHLSSQELRC